ncbi:hypothetical protein [Acetobacter fallax]|uniref:Uncharacterized protein n=1 Tax=Acetobacter fallax TaxID=1737473 RepID=A0ABX0K8R0_9PROT|nr:hypothetical protein [Acetobacter fallax]NHO32784.1 hypothetical protein [Acetobacter fallax]NHO36347.1 hypothetical protein [Acetobacter fallax]
MSGVIMYFQLMAWQQHLRHGHKPPSGRGGPHEPALPHLASQSNVVPLRPASVSVANTVLAGPGPFRRFYDRVTGIPPADALT